MRRRQWGWRLQARPWQAGSMCSSSGGGGGGGGGRWVVAAAATAAAPAAAPAPAPAAAQSSGPNQAARSNGPIELLQSSGQIGRPQPNTPPKEPPYRTETVSTSSRSSTGSLIRGSSGRFHFQQPTLTARMPGGLRRDRQLAGSGTMTGLVNAERRPCLRILAVATIRETGSLLSARVGHAELGSVPTHSHAT